ncbi:protein tyrosine phosphatase domain-containing protein 1-like [Sinocyclocheilus grahami]|uniref:protein tyrosine phosphatase domain-containing protein 1-like n=1 Tax=Sinocyclocheilus grahami TaxID=75366 RepID=UPI0007ACFD45|nr:PREDICTED: protein tyrosine phosphatase domain-containing protein 1-like [Sinocyclocheilus grahami]
MAAGVSLLSDLPYSTGSSANSRESSTGMEPVNVRVPTAKYTKVGETLRHVIPGHMQCSMACGGRACKYENPSRWSDKEQAIKGLYSSCKFYQAILFVRAKRPNSIQTRGQLLCVREVAQFLVPLRSVFPCAEPKAHSVTLSQYLTRQRHLLHGYEARLMKNVPKIVHLVCRLLLDIAENRQTVEEEVLDIPDLTEEVEKTVSLQALKQLGKEMRGKGIPISSPRSPDQPSLLLKESQCDPPHDRPLCSDQEFDVLWRWPTVDNTYKSQLILSKCFSYSDSALHKLDSRVQVLQSPQNALGCKSGLNFTEAYVSQSRLATQTPDLLPSQLTSEINSSPKHGSLTGSCSSLVQSKNVEGQASCSPVSIKRVPLKEAKRSMSYGFLGRTSDSMFSMRQGGKSHPSPNENTTSDVTQQLTDVPTLTLQSELPLETRRLFVAKALMMDIDGDDLRSTVSMWQTELNSREGAWERLCTERDPVVLSRLMWSWLEQLKEPIITKEDVETLAGNRFNPQHALNSLDKVSNHMRKYLYSSGSPLF